MKFAKLTIGKIQFATSTLRIGNKIVANPTEEQYRSQGWKDYSEQVPDYPSDGKRYSKEHLRYVETDTSIVDQYEWKLVEDAPKTYSKLKILVALTEIDKWYATNYLLEKNLIDGTSTTFKELWNAANEFKSDNKYFKEAVAKFSEKLQISAEQVENILKECEA